MAVSIAWNAGVIRGRLLSLHRLGRGGCVDMARLGSLSDAVAGLRRGPYAHDVKPGTSLLEAQWDAAATPLWHLRVLAGWLPPSGAELVRALAGWWEVLNVENLLARLAGMQACAPYDLGRLETAWGRLRQARSREQVRQRLARSAWLDPEADDAAAIVTWLRLSWAQRVSGEAEAGSRLAAGWAALVIARHRFLGPAALAGARRFRLLGARWSDAGDLRAFRRGLPSEASWVLDGVEEPEDLWRAEVRWWRTLDRSGQRLLRESRSGPEAVVGVFSVLLADAHRVQGALELAARGGRDREAVDEAL